MVWPLKRWYKEKENIQKIYKKYRNNAKTQDKIMEFPWISPVKLIKFVFSSFFPRHFPFSKRLAIYRGHELRLASADVAQCRAALQNARAALRAAQQREEELQAEIEEPLTLFFLLFIYIIIIIILDFNVVVCCCMLLYVVFIECV